MLWNWADIDKLVTESKSSSDVTAGHVKTEDHAHHMVCHCEIYFKLHGVISVGIQQSYSKEALIMFGLATAWLN